MILHTIVSPEFLLRSFEEAQRQGPESEYLPVSHGFLCLLYTSDAADD